MKVTIFSTDKNTLIAGTPAYERQQAYAKHFDAYDIILVRGRGLLGILRARHANVISAQDPFETGLLAWLCSRVFRTQLHIQVHTDFFPKGFVRGHMLNRVRRIIAPFVLRRAERIRVVSEGVKESIEQKIKPPAPITVLPIFVDAARYEGIARVKHPQFKIALLVVSRLEREKNIRLAITALLRAREAGHDAGLTIVGSGREEKSLKELVRTLRLDRYVVFAGAGDPLPHYASADALLVPSLYEGYGMVIVEALSAGIPVIATDVGIAREAGAIVSSEKDFAQTVVRWIESGPRQAALMSSPYHSFEEYVEKYCADISATTV